MSYNTKDTTAIIVELRNCVRFAAERGGVELLEIKLSPLVFAKIRKATANLELKIGNESVDSFEWLGMKCVAAFTSRDFEVVVRDIAHDFKFAITQSEAQPYDL